MGKLEQERSNDGGLIFAHRTRYVILVLSILCLTFIVGNMMALNFTIICMEEDNRKSSVRHVRVLSSHYLDEMFDASQRSWLFSAIAIGQLIGTAPITHLAAYVGFRYGDTLVRCTS